MKSRRPRGDEGATLLLALIFLGVFSLILGALLPAITGGLTNSVVVRNFDAASYVADSSIDYAIQQLRWDTTLCPDVASGQQTISAPQVDPRVNANVQITCKTTEGSVNNLGGYAIVATSSSAVTPGISASNGGSKFIGGPIWTKLLDPNPNQLDVGGNVQQSTSSQPCAAHPGSSTLASGSYDGNNALTVDAPFTISCFSSGSAPVPTVTAPDLSGTPSPLPDVSNSGGFATPALDLGDCKVYAPGVYTAPPVNAKNVYLASGVYWFNNVNWIIDGTPNPNVIGGEPSAGETYLNGQGATGCATDAAVENDNGRGVTIVLSGTSSITLNKGVLELFTRSGGASWEGTQGVTVETASGYTGVGNAVSIATGSSDTLALHGLVYAPTAGVSLGATASSGANVTGGVVASQVTLNHAANVANGTIVSVHSGIGFRRMLLTATVPGANGGRDVVATAVVDISNDTTPTVTVESRRNGGLSATT